MVYCNTAWWGEWVSGHLSILHFILKHYFNDTFEVQFFHGFILHLLKDTDIM